MASLWLHAVETLATAITGLPGYRAAATLHTVGDVAVYVGAQVDEENAPGDDTRYVVIGYGGPPDRPGTSGQFRQTRGPLDPTTHPRDESAEIRVRLVVQRGSGTVIEAAREVEGILGDVEGVLRVDPSLGIAVPTSRRFVAELTGAGAWSLRHTTAGPEAIIDCAVSYSARI